MNTNQLILIGISGALAVYVIYKLIGRFRRRKSADPFAPKMRTKGTAVPTPSIAVEPKGQEPQPVLQTVQTVEPTPEPVVAAESDAVEPAILQLEPKRQREGFWPSEPRRVANKTPEFLSDESLPHADPANYRFGGLTPTLAALSPSSEASRQDLQRALMNAGDYSVQAWSNFSALRYLGIILPILFFGALLIVVPERFEPWVMAGLIIGPMLGWALPALSVRGRARNRMHEIEIAMPDMLDLLNMCVSQGMTVPAAIRRVSRELRPVYPALSKELSIVTDQAKVGSLSQALTNFGRRVDVPDVHSFTSLLIQTEQMGTSVSEALEDYSDNMRESLRQRADEKANSATFKLLFPTVLCLMPAVFLFLMGPAVVELNRFFMEGGLEALRTGASAQAQNE